MNLAFWLSAPSVPHIEIAYEFGFRAVVLDIEHGPFDLDSLDRLIPYCRALGMTVHAKVVGPQAEAIQQALDFGADSVIIPHIADVDHARRVTAAAKYPPLGLRSLSAGRTYGYGPRGEDHNQQENVRVKCWPMIESAESLADVEKIAALPTVDGLFAGPSDLSLTRGRRRYAFSPDDQTDLIRIAKAANAAGKPWVIPAWTPGERELARTHGAHLAVVGAQWALVRNAFRQLSETLQAEGLR